ncbi:unnamed protein product, partial [Ilex paraguariensis]
EVAFYEDGEPIIDGESGDLRFRIRTAPHDRFKREGNDLHATITITLVQALVGFEKTIKHLDDHLVDISSKGITKPKEVKKFKGEGMPLHFSNKKGDLYVTFEVLFPTSLTEDQKTKIKAILELRSNYILTGHVKQEEITDKTNHEEFGLLHSPWKEIIHYWFKYILPYMA